MLSVAKVVGIGEAICVELNERMGMDMVVVVGVLGLNYRMGSVDVAFRAGVINDVGDGVWLVQDWWYRED